MDINTLNKIETLVQGAQAKVLDVDGRKYSTVPMSLINPHPEIEYYKSSTSTLEGFMGMADILFNGPSNFKEHKKLVAKVRNYNSVHLCSQGFNKDRNIECFLMADILDPRGFNFGTWLEPDEFIVGLMTQFVEDENVRNLIKVVSHLSEESAVAKGACLMKKVTVQSGVATKANVKIEPRVALRPYRTFIEVEQPKSEFILRIKRDKGVFIRLMEADGGAWKLRAMQNIRVWLQEELPVEIPVIL